MNQEIVFSETQKFKQPWIWIILLGLNGLIIYSIIQQAVYGNPIGNNPMSTSGLFITLALMLLLTALFVAFKLETRVSKNGLSVRLFPIHLTPRKYTWDQFSKVYVRQYRPIIEFGGWGLRGLSKNRALNVSGNKGLQLVFTNGKKLLIGTQREQELRSVLNDIGQIKE
ncbi:hypothetical protein CVV38_02565 [Candidatus Peregrinibacteria bacterium HGW-Peregrinibacteria-1]|jgi:hypothetical protein|nr:MAG: hypothetical protein CVV38_02565 [Candidatus Peregrinibacteria bacterium HGW-Peregrinibacteria-1]